MFTKHFFKVLMGFVGMILLGLFGLFLSNEYSKLPANSSAQVIDK